MTSVPDHFQLSHQKLDDFPLEKEDSVIIVLTYRCNSRCTFCIIETEITAKLPETKVSDVEKLFLRNQKDKQFSRLVLSGAEVTLRPDLVFIAQRAISYGGFDVVRIQTNARRLRKMAFAQLLYKAGIREYFISIHACTHEMDKQITRSNFSFPQMLEGLANLRKLNAQMLSNTVICKSNYKHLPQIATFIMDQGIMELHFWSFLEMGDVGQQAELISMPLFLPYLKKAIDIVVERGGKPTIKWLPKCALGEYGKYLDNHQPHMYIHEHFQQRLNSHFQFGCVHQNTCSAFRNGCEGLHQRYRQIFGEEEALLSPFGCTTQP